jgi:hypothetical protein
MYSSATPPKVRDVVQPFWAALQRGEFIADAAVAAGTHRKQGTRWVAACGRVRPGAHVVARAGDRRPRAGVELVRDS